MPKYKFVSVNDTLARIVRNLGYHLPSHYHDDIWEWMVEAIDQLTDTKLRIVASTPNIDEEDCLEIVNHVVELPSGFITILALEDEFGRRLPEASDITDMTSPTARYTNANDGSRVTVFGVNPLQHQTQDGEPTEEPGETIPIYGGDLVKANTEHRPGVYKIMGNHLQTSFETGKVKMHYLTMMLDDNGYPMIPDNENFKSAVYWYVLMMLMGAGYQHEVFNFQFCEHQFEKYGARALGEIKLASLDERARIHAANTRLIPPTHFHNNFFIGGEQGERLRK